MDDRVNDATGADGVDNHWNDEPNNWLKHNDTDVLKDNQSSSKDAEEDEVLDEYGCEWKGDLDIAVEALVEEFEDLVWIVDLILSYKPLIFLLIEIFSIVSLQLLEGYCEVRNCLESMLDEELVVILGVLKHAEEYRALNLVAVLHEGVYHWFILRVDLTI